MATGTLVDVVMPQMGVSVSEGTITKWAKSEGEAIEADETLLKDRRILRDEGFISVIVVVDSMTGKVIAGPEITARGFGEESVGRTAATATAARTSVGP